MFADHAAQQGFGCWLRGPHNVNWFALYCCPLQALRAEQTCCCCLASAVALRAGQYRKGSLQLEPGCNLEQTLEANVTGVLNGIREAAGKVRHTCAAYACHTVSMLRYGTSSSKLLSCLAVTVPALPHVRMLMMHAE
jgi:hypothetical protein